MRFKLAIILLTVTAFGAAAKEKDSKDTAVKGYLVDIACATDPTADGGDLKAKHTTKCLKMPACERSGYALLTQDNRVIKLDAKGNEIAEKLIGKTTKPRDWRIVATGLVEGDTMLVSRIRLPH